MNTPDSQATLNTTGAAVAILLVVILGCSVFALTRMELPKDNHDVILILVTAVATNITSIVQFLFGGSLGSKRKDDAIATLASTAATTAATQHTAQVALTPAAAADKIIPLGPRESVTVQSEEKKP